MSAQSVTKTKYGKFIYAARAIEAGQLTIEQAIAKDLINEEQAQMLREKLQKGGNQ